MPQQPGGWVNATDVKPLPASGWVDASSVTALNETPPPPTWTTAPGQTFSEKIANAARLIGSYVPSTLPTVGGIVGGIVGGTPGAAVGGAAGQGYKDLLSDAAQIPGAVRDVAQNLIAQPAATVGGFLRGGASGTGQAATQAALNASGEAVGNVLAKGTASAGSMLMRQAVDAPLALSREFPELSQTMIGNALTTSQGGLAQARTLLRGYKATANAALDQATAKGATIPIEAATRGLDKTFDNLAVNDADPVKALAKLASLEQKLKAGRNPVLTMREADALKTSLQSDASSLYRMVKAGNSSKGVALEAVAKADMAAALNQAIEDAATGVGVTGYKAANSSAQDMIGAVRAISRRVLQSPGGSVQHAVTDAVTPAVVGSVIAGGPGAAAAALGTMAGRAATSPSNLSRTALFLSHPAVQGFLRQLPLPVVQAIYGATRDSSTGPSQ